MGLSSITNYAGKKWAEKARDVETVIEQHALAGGALGAGISWFPLLGTAVASASMAAIVWSMYYRINKVCGIKISKAVLRSVAGAVTANIIAAAGSYIITVIASAALSFLPVASFVSAVMMAAANYGVVMIAGNVYAGIIQKFVDADDDGSGMTEDELKKSAAEIISDMNITDELKKNAYLHS